MIVTSEDFEIVKRMKQKIRNIKNKLVAIWWLITRKDYYLLSYNSGTSPFLESGNVDIPEFIEWLRQRHDVPTNHEIITELKNIGTLYKGSDILAYNEIKGLIEKLEK